MRKSALLIVITSLLFSGGGGGFAAPSDTTPAVSRNPFQPPSVASCHDDAVLAQWYVRGIIGDNTRWVGWLATPQRNWIQVEVGDPVPETAWYIAQLNQHEMRLVKKAAPVGCRGMAEEWALPAPGTRR